MQAGCSWKKDVLHIRDPTLGGPFAGQWTSFTAHQGTFWVQEECERRILPLHLLRERGQLFNIMFRILCPRSCEEYEAEPNHTPTNNWNPFQAFLENNDDISVSAYPICKRPKVPPIKINLMVADDDELGGEVEFSDVASLISFNNSSLVELISLSCDYKLSGGEALCHPDQRDSE